MLHRAVTGAGQRWASKGPNTSSTPTISIWTPIQSSMNAASLDTVLLPVGPIIREIRSAERYVIHTTAASAAAAVMPQSSCRSRHATVIMPQSGLAFLCLASIRLMLRRLCRR